MGARPRRATRRSPIMAPISGDDDTGNVEAVHRLLVGELKIAHVRAIIGFSMGAQQAFQWAVSYPGYSDRIVATAGTAKCYPHGVVRLEGQIAALTTDPTFENGGYKEQPKGLE